MLNITGFDPSLRNWGIANALLDLRDWVIRPTELALITTEKETSKQVRKSSDDLTRAYVLKRGIMQHSRSARVIFCEIPTGSQSASANKAFGIVTGLLTNIDVPVIQVTPTETKLASVGTSTASKEDVIAWAIDLYPELNWPMQKRAGTLTPVKAKCEHMADAVAVIHAGILTNQFVDLMAMYSSLAAGDQS